MLTHAQVIQALSGNDGEGRIDAIEFGVQLATHIDAEAYESISFAFWCIAITESLSERSLQKLTRGMVAIQWSAFSAGWELRGAVDEQG